MRRVKLISDSRTVYTKKSPSARLCTVVCETRSWHECHVDFSRLTPAHVLVEPLEGVQTVEIAFKVAWDLEHTLGAQFPNWQFIELHGSVRGQ
jgi:hypothetical protein